MDANKDQSSTEGLLVLQMTPHGQLDTETILSPIEKQIHLSPSQTETSTPKLKSTKPRAKAKAKSQKKQSKAKKTIQETQSEPPYQPQPQLQSHHSPLLQNTPMPQFPIITYPHICLGHHVPLPPPPPGGYPQPYPILNESVPPMFRTPWYPPQNPAYNLYPPVPNSPFQYPYYQSPFPYIHDMVQPPLVPHGFIQHPPYSNTPPLQPAPEPAMERKTSTSSTNSKRPSITKEAKSHKKNKSSTHAKGTDFHRDKTLDSELHVIVVNPEHATSQSNPNATDHTNNGIYNELKEGIEKVIADSSSDIQAVQGVAKGREDSDVSAASSSFESANENLPNEGLGRSSSTTMPTNAFADESKVKELNLRFMDGKSKKSKDLSEMFHSFNVKPSAQLSTQIPPSLESSVNSFKFNSTTASQDVVVISRDKGKKESLEERRKRNRKREKRGFINESVTFNYNKEYKRMKFINYDSSDPKVVASTGPDIPLSDSNTKEPKTEETEKFVQDLDFYDEYKKIVVPTDSNTESQHLSKTTNDTPVN